MLLQITQNLNPPVALQQDLLISLVQFAIAFPKLRLSWPCSTCCWKTFQTADVQFAQSRTVQTGVPSYSIKPPGASM